MVTDKPMSGGFGWGEVVRVIDTAPPQYQVIGIGSVCGMRSIETEDVAKTLDASIGSVLYLVEASDGQAIEIPERFLGLP